MPIDLATLANGALSFTLALAWYDVAGKSVKALYPPAAKDSPRVSLAIALAVTLMIIIIVVALHHAKKRLPRSTAFGQPPPPQSNKGVIFASAAHRDGLTVHLPA